MDGHFRQPSLSVKNILIFYNFHPLTSKNNTPKKARSTTPPSSRLSSGIVVEPHEVEEGIYFVDFADQLGPRFGRNITVLFLNNQRVVGINVRGLGHLSERHLQHVVHLLPGPNMVTVLTCPLKSIQRMMYNFAGNIC